jgi:hypothetical protein
MPAILLSLLPTIFSLFAPRAEAVLSKVTGRPAEQLTPFLQDFFGKIGQVTGIGTIKTDGDAIAAVAELQKLKAQNSELVGELEDHALDYLDKMAPLFDRLEKADAAANAALLIGRNAAMVRQQASDPESVRFVVQEITRTSKHMIYGLLAALVAAIAVKAWQPETPDYVTTIIALLGPLLGSMMKERGAVVAYYFDGTPSTNASSAINSQIVQASAVAQANKP